MTPWVDTILLVALVATSACVVPMYLKLKRLDRTQAEYGRILTQSGQALAQAGDAVRNFSTEGREILEALDQRIGEARQTLAGAIGAQLRRAPAVADAIDEQADVIAQLRAEADARHAQWEAERQAIRRVQELRGELERLRHEAEEAEA